MDYTTLEIVKSALRNKASVTTDDVRLGRVITDASRAIDRELTGAPDADAVNYLQTASVADEILIGQVNHIGVIRCYPHKPLITAVTAFAYRFKPTADWIAVTVDRIFSLGPLVEVYPASIADYSARCQIKLSYTGGIAAAVANLPNDITRAATILAIRYYREEETGLADAIGVADLSAPQGVVYTKAIPEQVLRLIQPYKRMVGWRHIA